jgi:hypothetical protein
MKKKKCFSNGCKTSGDNMRCDHNHSKACEDAEDQVCIIDGEIHIPYDSGVCAVVVDVNAMYNLIAAYDKEKV